MSSGPAWGFPFETGTQVTLGPLGLHDDNFSSVPGKNGTIYLKGYGKNPDDPNNPGVPDASLDLLPAQLATPVIPIAAGTIVSVWPLCHLVFIDLGNDAQGLDTWVEYLHVKVDPSLQIGQSVTRDTVLGTTTTEIATGQPCNEQYEGAAPVDHVHFAFLQGSGATGTYESMVGRMLCGHMVNTSPATADAPKGGAIDGLADAPGATFTVPECSSSSTANAPTATPTPVTIRGTISEFALAANSGPDAIATGPDGALWFTEETSNKIGRITPSGSITEFSLPAPNSGPGAITKGPDGNIWFTETTDANGSKIGRITTSGTVTEYTVPPSDSYLEGITTGPDGNIWFTDGRKGTIGRITPAGAITEYPNIAETPDAITTGPDGNLWVTDLQGRVWRITVQGQATPFAVPTSSPTYTCGITAGPDGILWFMNFASVGRITTDGSITEFAIPGAGTEAAGHPGNCAITSGPDGNAWFTETDLNEIGRITPTGAITEYSIPTGSPGTNTSSAPEGITVGPDGALWFTEALGDKIGRLG